MEILPALLKISLPRQSISTQTKSIGQIEMLNKGTIQLHTNTISTCRLISLGYDCRHTHVGLYVILYAINSMHFEMSTI